MSSFFIMVLIIFSHTKLFYFSKKILYATTSCLMEPQRVIPYEDYMENVEYELAPVPNKEEHSRLILHYHRYMK